jgi:NadR type nicotinamide-nucleotide adenylyltransferase
MLKRIAVIGPESTGKSTLCTRLAEHYNTIWVPEYAREHLEKYGLHYTYDDLLHISARQIELEDEMAKKATNDLLFIDTNLYVMKVWCEFVYERCHMYILNEIARRHYDCYILCDIDLPWEYQAMREYPDIKSRQRLFHMYKDILVNQHVPWFITSGSSEQRVQKVIQQIEDLR